MAWLAVRPITKAASGGRRFVSMQRIKLDGIEVNNSIFFSVPSETDNPWLKGPYRPNSREYSVGHNDLKIIGKVPDDLDGAYIRNTHNQVVAPAGVHHTLDGDALLHSMRFQDGKCEYRSRFVRTTGFYAEQGAKKALWPGMTQPGEYSRRGWGSMGAMKDNAGTDVIVHAGNLYSAMAQGSEPWVLSPVTLETLGVNENWAHLVPGITSHFKVDQSTGDMIFFTFSEQAPFLHYGVVSKVDKLVHFVPIDLPGARVPHDIGITENYSILHDLPWWFNPDLLKKGIRRGEFHPDTPMRFGVIPRFGQSKDVRWFEAKSGYMMHISNCYEDGDWVIQDGCRWQSAAKPPIGQVETDPIAKMHSALRLDSAKSQMYRWMFNMVTGEVREFPFDDEFTEFPIISNDFVGKPYRFSYNGMSDSEFAMIKGFKKYDVSNKTLTTVELGEGRFGSESVIARPAGSKAEDDGYLITFITDMEQDRSECLIMRADDLEGGPVCTIILPERISLGTHACWVEGDRLEGETRVLTPSLSGVFSD